MESKKAWEVYLLVDGKEFNIYPYVYAKTASRAIARFWKESQDKLSDYKVPNEKFNMWKISDDVEYEPKQNREVELLDLKVRRSKDYDIMENGKYRCTNDRYIIYEASVKYAKTCKEQSPGKTAIIRNTYNNAYVSGEQYYDRRYLDFSYEKWHAKLYTTEDAYDIIVDGYNELEVILTTKESLNKEIDDMITSININISELQNNITDLNTYRK